MKNVKINKGVFAPIDNKIGTLEKVDGCNYYVKVGNDTYKLRACDITILEDKKITFAMLKKMYAESNDKVTLIKRFAPIFIKMTKPDKGVFEDINNNRFKDVNSFIEESLRLCLGMNLNGYKISTGLIKREMLGYLLSERERKMLSHPLQYESVIYKSLGINQI